MSGHTPGPWRELITRIDDARGYQICHLDLHGKTESERDANRRLIAAAPELLDAAVEAAGCLSACVDMLRTLGRPTTAALAQKYHDAMVAAIAKAGGAA